MIVRKGRIKYYFKNKNAVINDVGKLCDMNEQLEQELDKYKNIVDELEEYLKEEERINNGIIINLTSGNVARMDAGVKNGVLDKVLDKLKELKGE